jgi:hypothetical protein
LRLAGLLLPTAQPRTASAPHRTAQSIGHRTKPQVQQVPSRPQAQVQVQDQVGSGQVRTKSGKYCPRPVPVEIPIETSTKPPPGAAIASLINLQLNWPEPVKLASRTGFPPRFVVHCCTSSSTSLCRSVALSKHPKLQTSRLPDFQTPDQARPNHSAHSARSAPPLIHPTTLV